MFFYSKQIDELFADLDGQKNFCHQGVAMFSIPSTPVNNYSKLSGFVRLVPIRPRYDDDVMATVAEGFQKPKSPALQKDVHEHLQDCQFAFSFVDAQDTLAGFALFKVIGNFLYLSGGVLRPAYQGKGLLSVAVLTARSITGSAFFALRTQSSLMWAAGRHLTHEWYPQSGIKIHSMAEMTRQLADKLGMASTIVPGFYGEALYGQKPLHKDAKLQAWWDSFVDFDRGDAVLCGGRF